MSSTGAALSSPRSRRLTARRLLLRHPELGPALVIVAVWVGLLVETYTNRAADGAASMAGMTGMVNGGVSSRHGWAQAAGGLPSWMLMTVAMMGPAALGAIGYTGLNSLRWRRRRAMLEYSVAYLAVWVPFGFLALAAAALRPGIAGPAALALVLAGASAWQLTPVKRRCLSGCHLSASLPPRGWRAVRGTLRFGLRDGLYCLGSCWCLMLVMVTAPGGQLLWTAGLTVVITSERVLPRPRFTTRVVAVMLILAAIAALATGDLLQ